MLRGPSWTLMEAVVTESKGVVTGHRARRPVLPGQFRVSLLSRSSQERSDGEGGRRGPRTPPRGPGNL